MKSKLIGELIVKLSLIFMFSKGVNDLIKGDNPKEAIVWIATALFVQLIIISDNTQRTAEICKVP